MTATPTPLRELIRDIHYAIAEDGALVDLSPVDYNKIRESIQRVLTPERIAALSARDEAGADEPLKVFSEGPWIFAETGQPFTGAALDAAAFAAYRAATPPAASGDAEALARDIEAWLDQPFVNLTPMRRMDVEAFVSRIRRLAAVAPPAASGDAEALARLFHDTYERLAPSFGYETRQDTRAFDPASANGRLMIAVCAEIRRLAAVAPAWKHEVALLEEYNKGYESGWKDGDRLAAADIDAMVNRFLAWPLPADFAPDAGISFTPHAIQTFGGPYWPTGTNLFTAAQAKAMFAHCLAAVAPAGMEIDDGGPYNGIDWRATLRAAAKRLRLGVEGPRIADELEALAAAPTPPATAGQEGES